MTSDSIPPTLVAATETDETALLPNHGGGPGRVIRAARERARLTLEELATQTKLARATLEALERDDFDALNEAVYVRGYYRKCAKVLGLSEAELIAAYEKLVVPKAPQAPTKLLLGSSPAMGRSRVRRRGNSGRVIGLVVVAAVIAALVWFFMNEPGVLSGFRNTSGPRTASVPVAATPSSSVVEPAPAPAPAPSEASPAVTAPEQQTEPSSSPASLPAASTPAPSPAAAPAAAPQSIPAATAAVAPATAGAGSLTLIFKATSWIRVDDADGRQLLSGVVQAGDRQLVRGRPPYNVFVGNAPGVTVEYEGKVVDVTPYIKSNSTARLTIP